jgi:hypothetical protein
VFVREISGVLEGGGLVEAQGDYGGWERLRGGGEAQPPLSKFPFSSGGLEDF